MIKNRIDIISMGCSKNLVDSEKLIYRLENKGYKVFHNAEEPCGEYVVVNTCGFIADAKEESIEMLIKLGELKEDKHIGKLIAMGCLSQRYLEDLEKEMPEVDKWYGKFDWTGFIDSLPDKKSISRSFKEWERKITTPPHSVYLKISEGCNRFCAFCAIPLITGRHKSRPIEEILEETSKLVKDGVKEFNVIAQDLSSYGMDLYGSHKLPELIDKMAEIPGVEFIRLHYAYPSDFPLEILDVMQKHDNVCKYIDIALQHVSDKVLENMRRHITKEQTIKLLKDMRQRVPDIKIRTTLMVGFPGETEKEFEELLEFVKEQKFDRMGAFAYSQEDDTWAAQNLDDEISEETKQERLSQLMELQAGISESLNKKMIGSEVKLIVDEIEGERRICRSQWDSPEVDMNYYVNNSDALPGDIIYAKITEALPFDFIAEQIEK